MWIIGGLVLIFLIFNANPRAGDGTPPIGVIECECSEDYDITCNEATCVYENYGDLCGTCVEEWSLSGGGTSPKGPSMP